MGAAVRSVDGSQAGWHLSLADWSGRIARILQGEQRTEKMITTESSSRFHITDFLFSPKMPGTPKVGIRSYFLQSASCHCCLHLCSTVTTPFSAWCTYACKHLEQWDSYWWFHHLFSQACHTPHLLFFYAPQTPPPLALTLRHVLFSPRSST